MKKGCLKKSQFEKSNITYTYSLYRGPVHIPLHKDISSGCKYTHSYCMYTFIAVCPEEKVLWIQKRFLKGH